MFKFLNEPKELTPNMIKRNMAITSTVLIIIAAATLLLSILRKQYHLLWVPALFLILLAFSLYVDYGKLKEVNENLRKDAEDQTKTEEQKQTKTEEK